MALCNFLNFQMSEKPRSLLQLLRFFLVCRPHGVQRLRTFLQVGHSGLQSNQGFIFHILVDSLLLSVNLASSLVFVVVFHGAQVFVDMGGGGLQLNCFQQSLTTKYPNVFGVECCF